VQSKRQWVSSRCVLGLFVSIAYLTALCCSQAPVYCIVLPLPPAALASALSRCLLNSLACRRYLLITVIPTVQHLTFDLDELDRRRQCCAASICCCGALPSYIALASRDPAPKLAMISSRTSGRLSSLSTPQRGDEAPLLHPHRLRSSQHTGVQGHGGG
jgi:hypothetical protein